MARSSSQRRWPTAAAYHVDVTSSPAGETCTIANPDGTIASDVGHRSRSAARIPGVGCKPSSQGTDANGIASYAFTSADDGDGTHVLRVLTPTDPAPGVPHNFLYVLPVEPEQGTQFGDAIQTLSASTPRTSTT